MSDNKAQIEFWNGPAADSWIKGQEGMDRSLSPFSDAAVAVADPQAGERVIDIGCGCGGTTGQLAASGASVWGVDISAPMIAYAKQRFADEANVAFSEGDASVLSYTPDHNLVFSRFGVMFFADPIAAFANIRTALVPGGRLVFVCWQAASQNSWITVPAAALKPFLPSQPPADPYAPGPFAFAEFERVKRILEEAGFQGVSAESVLRPFYVGADVDSAARSQTQAGPLARALMQLDESERGQALASVAAALQPYAKEDGVWLEGATWLVTAQVP